MDGIRATLQWVFLFLSNVVLVFIGLVYVAIAIPFAKDGASISDGRRILNLPRWAWLFGNDADGLLGDKRGWWAENTPFGIDVNSFLAKWWWAAIRNPVNNKRRLSLYSAPIVGSKITYSGNYTVEDKPGMGGWQFVTAEQGGKKWYGFYLVHEWSLTRALVIRLGFKIKPSHAGKDEEPKGMTTKINPFKAI
ncbi:hypothetical protein D3C84_380020 [compost metagenome]